MPEVATDAELLAAFRAAVRAKIRRDLAEELRQAEALRADIVPRVAEAIASARASGLCGRAWLFGSFAWGQPGARSDVDILIEAPDAGPCATLVERACGRMVHCIAWGQAPQSLRDRVLAEGHLL